MNILFINACPRKDSRTKILADYLLTKINGDVQERNLTETALFPLSEKMLDRRTALAEKGDFNHPLFQLANEFASADIIVIAAPFWDLSFPALLKVYIENINVVGITFSYNQDGTPHGLCKAKKLYYVTTAGGPIVDDSYGYGYVKELAQKFYEIAEISCIKAENLDIENADVAQIMDDTKRRIDAFIL
ncbi:MAG: NAD(P)H-dependent oxidoreductase [Elusimicrobiaceae bacterium]|nr:NAD(P)H-dependent oxidoreductase [Elusimicrobiaceae bacterium]